jgi:hypothetical protein
MRLVYILALLALAAWPLSARAEHADIDLRVIRVDPATGQDKEEVHASADREPPAGGRNLRPLLKVKVNEPLVLQFMFINTYPHGEKKDVTVRYFVVPETKPRQPNLPDLRQNVVTQGSFVLDFKPKAKVGARIQFRLKTPGYYLVRVGSLHTDSDHEHFSAIDLQAE